MPLNGNRYLNDVFAIYHIISAPALQEFLVQFLNLELLNIQSQISPVPGLAMLVYEFQFLWFKLLSDKMTSNHQSKHNQRAPLFLAHTLIKCHHIPLSVLSRILFPKAVPHLLSKWVATLYFYVTNSGSATF